MKLPRTGATVLVSIHRLRVVALLLMLILALLLSGCAQKPAQPLTGDALLLGTVIRISISDRGFNKALIDRVFDRIATIEARMSTSTADYDDTELLRVNRAGGEAAVTVSDDTMYVLTEAVRFSRMTEGAFEVSIGPLVQLWGIGTEDARVPAPEELESVLPLVDYREAILDPAARTVYLPRAGMGLDVGGIAKGYAADEAARMLQEAGVTSALLDFGGNILVIGAKPDGSPWRIGVQRPDAQRSAYIGIVAVTDRTVVTSGPYERYFELDGTRYHHILDSSTGYPADAGLTQVTIIAERSIEADALSTACYVMGLDRAFSLVSSLPGVEALFVDDRRNIYMTSGAEGLFSVTDPDYRAIASGTPSAGGAP